MTSMAVRNSSQPHIFPVEKDGTWCH